MKKISLCNNQRQPAEMQCNWGLRIARDSVSVLFLFFFAHVTPPYCRNNHGSLTHPSTCCWLGAIVCDRSAPWCPVSSSRMRSRTVPAASRAARLPSRGTSSCTANDAASDVYLLTILVRSVDATTDYRRYITCFGD